MEVVSRVEAAQAVAIATAVLVRRPMECTCPGRAGIIFGLRRLPRVADVDADSHMQRLVTAAAPAVRALVNGDRAADLEAVALIVEQRTGRRKKERAVGEEFEGTAARKRAPRGGRVVEFSDRTKQS